MLSFTTFLLFLAGSWTINIAPGPDMLYVLTKGAQQGRRAGLVAALGISIGSFIQVCIVALGLASILTAVPLAYELVKYLGAAYLVYLGIRAILKPQITPTVPAHESTRLWRILGQGIITDVLNPKVALFYLAFLPQFTDPARGSVPLQMIILGIIFNISGTIINCIVALLAGSFGSWLKRHAGASKILNWLSGGIFIGLGVRLALLKRQ